MISDFTDRIEAKLKKFDKVPLVLISSNNLMTRKEQKFILNEEQVLSLLNDFTEDFLVLDVEGNLQQAYKTTYFDTPELQTYYDHYRGKANRFKVRKRSYESNNQSFFEIKLKNNKGITSKHRIETEFFEETVNEQETVFLQNHLPQLDNKTLTIQLNNQFKRIVLQHKSLAIRLTFDYEIQFKKELLTNSLPTIVIAELKYEKQAADYIRKITNLGEVSSSFSKYCIGMSLLNKNVKRIKFKSNLIKIKQWTF